jgi:cell division septation protein DedD
MTKDFKKQAAADSTLGQYGLGWMAGGITIGLLIGAGMYVLANKGTVPDAASNTPPAAATATLDTTNPSTAGISPSIQPGTASQQDVAAPVEESGSENPGFSYHAVLPQLEVDVPIAVEVEQQAAAAKQAKEQKAANKAAEKPTTKAETDTTKTAEKPSTEAAPALQPIPTGFNGFQVGSYKTAEQASNLQNRLQRGGLNTRVEQANVKGEVWFRVRLGPATSPDMMQKWQQTLSGMGISPLAVRM